MSFNCDIIEESGDTNLEILTCTHRETVLVLTVKQYLYSP